MTQNVTIAFFQEVSADIAGVAAETKNSPCSGRGFKDGDFERTLPRIVEP